MTNALSLASHEAYLSDTEVNAYITVAQSAPYDQDADTFGTTPETDRALEELTKAFLPLIYKVARTSSLLDEDEAVQVCLEEFLSVIRRYEVGSALPFKAGLRTVLLRKIGDVGRTSGLIVVKENAAARYRQLMDRHDWDLGAAYRECADTANGFEPETFLAVHNALGVDSLDATLDARYGMGSSKSPSMEAVDGNAHEADLADPSPSPEEQTVQAETVRWLFQQVAPQQESILRLGYGFTDLATENARLAAGFRADGSPLSDKDVAHVLGMKTPTVNRHRNTALSTMRDALTDED